MHSPPASRSASREPLYKSTSLETRSRSPSPGRRHGAGGGGGGECYYGGPHLTDRSRSPSPASTTVSERLSRSPRKLPPQPLPPPQPQHGVGRKLPALPQKPSSLNIPPPAPSSAAAGRRGGGGAGGAPPDNMPQVLPSPTVPPHVSPNMNLPRLNASPTRYPNMHTSPRPGRRTGAPPPSATHFDYPPPSSSLRQDETNNLNMPPSFHQQQQQPGAALSAVGGGDGARRHAPFLTLDRRTNSGGDAYSLRQQQQRHGQHQQQPNIPRSHSGQYLSRSQLEKDNRYLAQRYDQEMALRRSGFHPSAAAPGSTQTLPNGFKPAHHRVSGRALHSESDDDDWC